MTTTESLNTPPRALATLGLFIIDEFSFAFADGRPTGETRPAEARRPRPGAFRTPR
jgi:hypothetical protein